MAVTHPIQACRGHDIWQRQISQSAFLSVLETVSYVVEVGFELGV